MCVCLRGVDVDDMDPRAVPDEVTAVYTRGHVLRITCPTKPKQALYQRNINVSVEPAAMPVPASSLQNAHPGGSSQAPPVAGTRVSRQPPLPRSVLAHSPEPPRVQQPPQPPQPPQPSTKPPQRPASITVEQHRRPPEPSTPHWQQRVVRERERERDVTPPRRSKRTDTRQHRPQQPLTHDRSAEHSPRQNRKDYVRSPPRECTGRYCRRNWLHGTAHSTAQIPRDGEEDVVVFVADEAGSSARHNETGAGQRVSSVTEILEKEGELDVEEYIRAVEIDLARIKNAM